MIRLRKVLYFSTHEWWCSCIWRLIGIKNNNLTSIIIISNSSIYRSLESIICFFDSTKCHLICYSDTYSTMIESNFYTIIISSCIMDKFLYISKSFRIYDIMKSFEIRIDNTFCLYIRKIFYTFRRDWIITKCHIFESCYTIYIVIFWSSTRLMKLF